MFRKKCMIRNYLLTKFDLIFIFTSEILYVFKLRSGVNFMYDKELASKNVGLNLVYIEDHQRLYSKMEIAYTKFGVPLKDLFSPAVWWSTFLVFIYSSLLSN